MTKVSFISFYNDFSVGVNVLSSVLMASGKETSVFFFKLPSKQTLDWFTTDLENYMEVVDHYGNIIGGNAQTNRWTDMEVDLLSDMLNEIAPDVICLSSRTMDNELAKDVYPRLRERVDAVFLAGGFGPSLSPEIYAPLVDYVFVGEAEACINNLVDKIVDGEDIAGHPNIFYMDGETLEGNRLGPPDELRFDRQTTTDQTYYIDNDTLYTLETCGPVVKSHTYSTFFGRGCIQKCSYCSTGNWRELYKKEGFCVTPRRNRQVDTVIDEIAAIKDTGVTFMHFRDEFMAGTPEEMKRLFTLYEREIGIPFWAYLVPQQMLKHPEILRMAVDAGFVDTELGFQSGSNEINRTIFNRTLSHKYTLEYTKMLAEYDINMKYDFIIFNPAEKSHHIEETYELLQALPKKRAYVFMPRLFYFPSTPIFDLLADHPHPENHFEHYYWQALMFLLCFAATPKDFAAARADKTITGSWQSLKEFYLNYLKENDIEFAIGTHERPESITAPRYGRILESKKFSEVVVWKDTDYFEPMRSLFEPENKVLTITDNCRQPEDESVPEQARALAGMNTPAPIFVCSPRKLEIKKAILKNFPDYPGRIYV